MKNTKVCLFSHFSSLGCIPNYVIYYLEKLSKHMDKIVLITNNRFIKNGDILNKMNIDLHFVQNKGYDFGMYHQYLLQSKNPIGVQKYDQLYLVNDSMILFNNLDNIIKFFNNKKYDYSSITESTEFEHHLQSYFLCLSSTAIQEFLFYLRHRGVYTSYSSVVKEYEIGLSKNMKNIGLSVGSFISNKSSVNMTIRHAEGLIESGFPMLKKKVLLNSFNVEEIRHLEGLDHNFNFDYWSLINEYKEESLNINYLDGSSK